MTLLLREELEEERRSKERKECSAAGARKEKIEKLCDVRPSPEFTNPTAMEPALRGGGTPVLVALLLVGLCSTCAGGKALSTREHKLAHKCHFTLRKNKTAVSYGICERAYTNSVCKTLKPIERASSTVNRSNAEQEQELCRSCVSPQHELPHLPQSRALSILPWPAMR